MQHIILLWELLSDHTWREEVHAWLEDVDQIGLLSVCVRGWEWEREPQRVQGQGLVMISNSICERGQGSRRSKAQLVIRFKGQDEAWLEREAKRADTK